MKMTKDTKDAIQYGSAVLMLASGVVLVFLCFFLNGHVIDDSVLFYVGQCLVYAGSIFGVAVYVNSKIEERMKRNERQEGDNAKN